MTRTLVLGGARSGKSAFAERLALDSGKEIVYIATARNAGSDSEMNERISHHRARRPAHWTTVEQPMALAAELSRWCAPQRLVLVDCLTLWLSNLMFEDGTLYPDVGTIALPQRFHDERADLLHALGQAGCDIVLVSNEVGMGIVPFGAISRCFADEAGRLNQAAAAICDRAVLLVAGLPLTLKGAPC